MALSHSVSECQSDESAEFAIFSQNLLPWQRPLRYRKKRPRSIICTQNDFIRWKDCENRSSKSGDIWPNMPNPTWTRNTISICYRVLHQNYWTDLHQNFTRYSGISDAIKSCIYKVLVHSVSDSEYLWKKFTYWTRQCLTALANITELIMVKLSTWVI